MTVLVDATAVPADRRGVGRYVDELIAALDGQLIIACQAVDEAHYRSIAPTASILPQRGITASWRRLAWEQAALPRIARRAGATVIHSPHYTLPLVSRLARVVTFHDATFFSDPGVHTPLKRLFFRAWIRLSAALADSVIVPSAATGAELTRYVGTPRRAPEYVVAHHGVDHRVFHPPSAQEISYAADVLKLGPAWIAFLGTLEPRKNLPALIAAYGRLAGEGSALPKLAIAGGEGWATDLRSAIAAVPEGGEVVTLGYIDLGLVPAYLGGAVIVVYPSLGEGFGLPVLEAMASGAAVLTTARLAIPEVGADAVSYTEPDVESMVVAIRSLLADPATRQKLRAKATTRAAGFTWQASARIHRDVYRRVERPNAG